MQPALLLSGGALPLTRHDRFAGDPYSPASQALGIVATDESLGALMRHMEELGVLDNTVIIVKADHGVIEKSTVRLARAERRRSKPTVRSDRYCSRLRVHSNATEIFLYRTVTYRTVPYHTIRYRYRYGTVRYGKRFEGSNYKGNDQNSLWRITDTA